MGPTMIIQIVLIPALIAAVWLSLRSRASLRGQARRKLLALVTVVCGVVAVLVPDSLQWLADRVGVTRGTDLLLYGFALVIIYLVGSTSARFREQEARLVLLARQVALSDAALRQASARDGQPTLSTLHSAPDVQSKDRTSLQ
jgi:small membrane protein